jgi:hypothetical protein
MLSRGGLRQPGVPKRKNAVGKITGGFQPLSAASGPSENEWTSSVAAPAVSLDSIG